MEPTSLDTMLEAVEKYMGEQFTDMLVKAVDSTRIRAYISGCYGEGLPRPLSWPSV